MLLLADLLLLLLQLREMPHPTPSAAAALEEESDTLSKPLLLPPPRAAFCRFLKTGRNTLVSQAKKADGAFPPPPFLPCFCC
jgi:hypothetical protein